MTDQSIAALDGPVSREFRVMLLVQNEIVRNGLSAMLRSLPCVADVEASEPVPPRDDPAAGQPFDIVILALRDLSMESVHTLVGPAWRNGMKVLLLLDRDQQDELDRVSALPSDGFLFQDDLTSEELHLALQKVHRGDVPMPAALATRLLVRAREGVMEAGPKRPNLTPRERQVLQLLVEGLSNKQIARRLHISQHGVKRIVSNVLAKLNCSNRTLAVAVALTDRILTDE